MTYWCLIICRSYWRRSWRKIARHNQRKVFILWWGMPHFSKGTCMIFFWPLEAQEERSSTWVNSHCSTSLLVFRHTWLTLASQHLFHLLFVSILLSHLELAFDSCVNSIFFLCSGLSCCGYLIGRDWCVRIVCIQALCGKKGTACSLQRYFFGNHRFSYFPELFYVGVALQLNSSETLSYPVVFYSISFVF